MVVETLISEIERMDSAIEWAQSNLKNAPEGRLLVDKANGEARFFWRRNAREKKGAYLGKGSSETIRALAQKDYEKNLLDAATDEKTRLEKMLATYEGKGRQSATEAQDDVLAHVYDRLPSVRKQLVEPYTLNNEEYARRWSQVEFSSNGHPFGACAYYSRQGQRVRSKSEVIIADLLDAAGVPFRYEQALHIGGYSPVYPDFTVLNKRTRAEYIWEHFGAMDDQEYCRSALQKLSQYALAGFFPGDRLLVTQESASVPLDTRVVNSMIERYLS